MDVAVQKRRMILMLAVCAVCTLVAVGAIVGNLAYGIGWMLWLFFAAIGIGFVAQGWLIMGLAKATRDARPKDSVR